MVGGGLLQVGLMGQSLVALPVGGGGGGSRVGSSSGLQTPIAGTQKPLRGEPS